MILPNPDHFSTAASSPRIPAQQANDERPTTIAGLTSTDRAALADLVIRARTGEPAAQSELVRKYTRRISGHVRIIIHQPDAVEDVVQTVFIKMFRRLSRLRDPGSFESWLFRLSRNTALDFIRRRRCRPVTVPVENELFEIPDPANASATNEIIDALEAALDHVGPKDRDLLKQFIAGHSYQVLATRAGLTMGAVKARLHRIRPFLRSFVGDVTGTRLPGSTSWSKSTRSPVAA